MVVKKKSHKKIYYRTPPKIQEKVTFPWLENDTVIKITFSAFRPSEGESWVKDFSIKIEMQIIHFAAAERSLELSHLHSKWKVVLLVHITFSQYRKCVCLHLTSCLLEFSLFGFLLCPLAASTVLCSSFFNRAESYSEIVLGVFPSSGNGSTCELVSFILRFRALFKVSAAHAVFHFIGMITGPISCAVFKNGEIFQPFYFSQVPHELREWVITLSRLGQQIAQDAKFQIKSFTGLLLS